MPVFVIFDYRGIMSEEKNCNLKITSNVLNLDENEKPDGAPEKDELCALGEIKTEKGKTTLSYKEKRDGAAVLCEIVATGDSVTVRRRGDVVCDMLFSPQKSYKTLYNVPPFSFDMEIYTVRIENSINEESGSLSLIYNMTVGGAKKRCRMKIKRED